MTSCTFLHHLPPFRQISGIIIRRPDIVSFAVGKLAFEPVSVVAKLVQEGRCHKAKAVSAYLMFFVTHTAQSRKCLSASKIEPTLDIPNHPPLLRLMPAVSSRQFVVKFLLKAKPAED
jgi:hypothetical protein